MMNETDRHTNYIILGSELQMPREYQLKTTGNALSHNVHMQVVYIIRDHPRLNFNTLKMTLWEKFT